MEKQNLLYKSRSEGTVSPLWPYLYRFIPNFWIFEDGFFWVVAPCSLVEVSWRLRGSCCLHHQSDEWNVTKLPSDYTQNPEDNHLFIPGHDNLKSQFWIIIYAEILLWLLPGIFPKTSQICLVLKLIWSWEIFRCRCFIKLREMWTIKTRITFCCRRDLERVMIFKDHNVTNLASESNILLLVCLFHNHVWWKLVRSIH